MQRLAIILVLALGLIPGAAAAGVTYRSAQQADNYLQHALKRWAGVDLWSKKYKFHPAFCLSGARSKYEQRHRHFAQRTSETGNPLFHTFACTLSAADKVWHVYLVARPNGTFSVRDDK